MTRYDPDDPSARVSAHVTEVPGEPEEVWRAIATGPGISTWFVPAEVEEREGGRIVTHHGPFGTSAGVVTAWEPPHRFAYEERDWDPDAPDAPPWATELLVESRGGGTCVVRLVSGFFTGGEGWEEQLEGTDEGWRGALRTLRLALTHFPGLPVASMEVFGSLTGRSADDAAGELLPALGLAGASPGDRVDLDGGAPPTTGTVVDAGPRGVTLHVERPHPGVLEVAAFSHGGTTVAVRAHLFGAGGTEAAAREAPRWTAWLGEHLPGFSPLT
ncbi:SRPBCC family protein [Geodermatophilus marinus]|uniref:SRPBCC family protein n=1 Tax=Geodermatophilus sp. LHW52908 TaxID=2303986 RepID=UPI001313FA26|nr:SRPBCC domain-containing protein [Geodermatophilus sp. LHW52908]